MLNEGGCQVVEGDRSTQALDSHEDRCHLLGKELTEWLDPPPCPCSRAKPGSLGSLGAPEMETEKLQE